jgi:hypothetical protein
MSAGQGHGVSHDNYFIWDHMISEQDAQVHQKGVQVLGCYILCSESLVEVDRLIVKVKGRAGLTK